MKYKNYSMVLSDEILTEISFVEISTYRTKVVKSLKKSYNVPTGIAKDVDLNTNHVSKVLSELKAHGIVVCVNPEARKGRLYRLTEKGELIAEHLKK